MRRRQILKASGALLAAPVLAQLARPFDALAKTEQVVATTPEVIEEERAVAAV